MGVTRRAGLMAAGLAAAGVGCVDRRYVVDTNVPGAQIAVDGRPLGPSPADARYTYPGRYQFRAVAPGYKPLTRVVRLAPRWYDYPGLDFLAEVLLPYRIEDVRRVRLELEPAEPPRTDDLTARAEELRARGRDLPPASVPDDPVGPATAGPPVTPPPIAGVGPPFAPTPAPGNQPTR